MGVPADAGFKCAPPARLPTLTSPPNARVPCVPQAPPAEPAAGEESGDLLLPQYSTDEFRMFSFKIDCCPRLSESHDWTLCPFQHPGACGDGARVGHGLACRARRAPAPPPPD